MKKVLFGIAILLLPLAAQTDEAAENLYKQGVAAHKANPSQIYKLFAQAADAGNPVAMTSAGHCCETGTGTETNYAKSIEWYEKAIEYNSIKACEGLARIYASCADPEFHDGEKAVKYATPVARKNPRDANAQSLLAAAYARNIEFYKAIKLSKKAIGIASLGKGDELKARHKKYLLGSPYPAIATEAWMLQAANRDSVWAMSQMAIKSEDTNNPMHNLANARRWRERAAKLGNQKDDLFHAGYYLIHGIGGTADIEKGMKFLEQAAELESDKANTELGNIYIAGTIVPRDPDKAYKYYCSIKEVDNGILSYKLEVLRFEKTRRFLRGIKPKELHELGENCVPQKGNQVANAQGRLKEPNYRRALVYYLIAAEQGYVPAMKNAADLCMDGGRLEETRSRINKHAEPNQSGWLLKSLEARETKPFPKEAAKWYFELAKRGKPYLPSRSHEKFSIMAERYNGLAKGDGQIPLLEVD